MAPKEAKKRMKASEHKKYKLLQTTMGPTPRIVFGELQAKILVLHITCTWGARGKPKKL